MEGKHKTGAQSVPRILGFEAPPTIRSPQNCGVSPVRGKRCGEGVAVDAGAFEFDLQAWDLQQGRSLSLQIPRSAPGVERAQPT